jgi:hypothetical protein
MAAGRSGSAIAAECADRKAQVLEERFHPGPAPGRAAVLHEKAQVTELALGGVVRFRPAGAGLTLVLFEQVHMKAHLLFEITLPRGSGASHAVPSRRDASTDA